MISITVKDNAETPEAACCRQINELAYEHRREDARVAENHYRTIRLMEACAGPFYGVKLFSSLRSELMTAANSLRNQSREPLKCAVVGEFSAGKSTLINTLIGMDDFLPVNLGVTTALVSQLEYSKFPVVQLVMKNGESKESSIEEYRRLVDENCAASERDMIEKVTVKVDYTPLKYVTIIDTPGLNATFAEHQERTIEHINKVQVVLFVFTADKPVSATQLKSLDAIRSHGCKVYGIINRIDAIRGFNNNPERWNSEMKRVLEIFNQHCGNKIERFIPLSAKEATLGRLENAPDRIVRSNFQELKTVIIKELADNSEKIKNEHLAQKVSQTAGLGVAVERFMSDYQEASFKGLSDLRKGLANIEADAKNRFDEEYQKAIENGRHKPTPWDHL